ncbi:MAG: hypothetical protein GEU95_03705 [Rhizobiales bacterium]|nr:hypothetical protein [Hyphomicrobiales bacterium]
MNDTGAGTTSKRKAAIWLAVGLGLLLLFAANGHLVYVAMTSQPDCVDHIRQGEANAAHSRFSAARSSCSPG